MDSTAQEDPDGLVLDVTTPESRHPCVSCQRRKVKCDRKSPCSRCLTTGQECRQPETRRAPRRARRAVRGLVSEKLRQLEKSLDEVRAAVLSGKSEEIDETAETAPIASEGQSQSLDNSLGRLIIESENSRYISSSSWANLADQVLPPRQAVAPPLLLRYLGI
jgi:ABC-type molybdenum transport system ATPase subunit/photorepair protein PhrA